MVEVFKTDVNDSQQAEQLLDHIHSVFRECMANFDLDDCDKILRVKSSNGNIEPSQLIHLLHDLGVAAEVLAD